MGAPGLLVEEEQGRRTLGFAKRIKVESSLDCERMPALNKGGTCGEKVQTALTYPPFFLCVILVLVSKMSCDDNGNVRFRPRN